MTHGLGSSRFDGNDARTAYLAGVLARHGTLALPIGATERRFALQAVYQPLTLRRDPLAAEDLTREQRRKLLGESAREDEPQGAPPPGEARAREDHAPVEAVTAAHGVEALARSPAHRMVVLGAPGTGKTTVLKEILCGAARKAQIEPSAALPIFVFLPDLARSAKALDAYLPALVRDLGADPRYAAVLWDAIARGHALVCLDSLDEVAPAQRPDMIALINRLAPECGGAWVVGSRFSEYKGGQFARGQFAEWEIQALGPVQRAELARRLLPVLHQLLHGSEEDISLQIDPAPFVAALAAHPHAAAWGQNPLLFSLAAAVYVQEGALPSSRAALYGEVVSAVLRTRAPDSSQRIELRRVLAELALRLHQTKERTFTRQELFTLLPEVGAPANQGQAIYDLGHRLLASGVFDVVARDTYGFRHQTFQEYLAAAAFAQALSSQDNASRQAVWDLAWSKRTYSRWTEVLRQMVGVLVHESGAEGAREAQHWLHALAAQATMPEGDVGYLGLSLAVTSLPELGVVSSSAEALTLLTIEKDIVARWVDALFSADRRSRRPQRRRLLALASAIAYLRPAVLDEVIGTLIAALDDAVLHFTAREALKALGRTVPVARLLPVTQGKKRPADTGYGRQPDLDARVAAIELLGGPREDAPVDVLVGIMRDRSRDSSLRKAATSALGALGARAPIEPLIAVATNSEELALRVIAMWTLGGMNDRAPVELLVSALQDENWHIRSAAAQSLAYLQEKAPIEPLIAALHDESAQVRCDALHALRGLGQRMPVDLIVSALTDQAMSVREAALDALTGLGGAAPVGSMSRMLRDENDFVQSDAIDALATCGFADALVTALHLDSDYLRMKAVEALGNLGTRAPLDALLTALQDPEFRVRCAAVAALAKRGDLTLAQDALRGLARKNAGKRTSAVAALGALGERAPLDPLLAALHDGDRFVRMAAVRALGQVGSAAPVEPLIAALCDQVPGVRQTAARVLGTQAERVPAETFIPLLSDSEENVRRAAVWALGQCGARVPVEPLVQAIRTGGDFALAEVLGRQGERVPMEDLMSLAADPLPRHRTAAVRAFGAMGQAAPIEPLLALLREPEVAKGVVRAAAAEALGQVGNPVAVGPLIEALRDDDRWLRHNAALALGTIGDPVAIGPLLGAMEIRDAYPMQGAAKALGMFGERMPVQELTAMLDDPRQYAREAVVEAMGHAGRSIPVERLKAMLANPDEPMPVRKAAARVLGTLGDEAPLEELVAAFADPDPHLRYWVAGDLIGLGARAPIDLLVAAMGDPENDYWARVAAAGALWWLAEQDEVRDRVPVGPLLAALDSDNTELQQMALAALGALGGRAPVEAIALALNDRHLCENAAAALKKVQPAILADIAAEATPIALGQESSMDPRWFVNDTVIEVVENSGYATPEMLAQITHLSEWPYSGTRLRAAQGLGKVRRNMPDAAIRRMLELRERDPSRAVREASDDALAEILSLETGIEDD
jgi:HEAT repeat protein